MLILHKFNMDARQVQQGKARVPRARSLWFLKTLSKIIDSSAHIFSCFEKIHS